MFFPSLHIEDRETILYKATVLDEVALVISGNLVLMILKEIQVGGRSW